jgi:Tfp pilus assembly protein FimT
LTLLETILVMVLALTVMGLVAPRLGGFSRRRVLIAQGRSVLAMLRTARDRAAAECVPHRVTVDPQAGLCRLLVQTGATFEPVDSSTARRLTLRDGVTIALERLDEGDEPCVTFQPTGEGTPARVTLTDRTGQTVGILARTPLEPFALLDADDREVR